MSGICGIVHLDDTPVDRELLLAMTAFMTFRGPDAQDVRADGSVGFGHTMLHTTVESEREHQPCSLDGQVWITADARIDGRDELKRKLHAGCHGDLSDATDVDLILHAYHAWGNDCVQHLIGDFVFAIWDGLAQRLFCARDHFGVKPFFYAQAGNRLVFSNTLNCVRQHPTVSDALNDLAIADFLLFESVQEPDATSFADIRRLPPAHALTWSATGGLQVARYWQLPTDLGVRHRSTGDYVAHFRELLNTAVADRLRTRCVGVEMSGGLDSASIAAVAKGILSQDAKPFALQAQTIVYDELIPDQERLYASLVARHLGIPIHFIVADSYGLYERREPIEACSPEPVHNVQPAMSADASRSAAAFGRVWLTGWDGDALLSESLRPHLRALVQSRQYVRLVVDLLRFVVTQRRVLPKGWLRSLRLRFAAAASEENAEDGYPAWLNPEIEARLKLRQRWEERKVMPRSEHPTRPYAYTVYQYLASDTSFFDAYDPGLTGQPLEYRHPLMDLRLMDFCLSLPLQPWVVKKHILRVAMRSLLPEAVRTRPKSPLAGWPHMALLERANAGSIFVGPVAPVLGRYVQPDILVRVDSLILRRPDKRHPDESWLELRLLSLMYWLNA